MKQFLKTPRIFKRTKLYNTPYHESKEGKFRIFEDGIVPNPSKNISIEDLDKLKEFITSKKPITVISGAGLSTESGIPDYRSPNGSYSKGHRPILFKEYISSEKNRKRYWARNMIGYRLFKVVKPNEGHHAIKHLQDKNIIKNIITQNVDELHQTSGSKNVINLHGSNHEIICLDCRKITSRKEYQERLEMHNEGFLNEHNIYEKRSDGDVELSETTKYEEIHVPNCIECNGILKPNVVFFGESVGNDIVDSIKNMILNETNGLLVVGSSLQVFSSFRFLKYSLQHNVPIAIINIGETRADSFCDFKIEGKCSEILNYLSKSIE
eukprot:gene10003-2322_t